MDLVAFHEESQHQRKGKWTAEEEEYAELLKGHFSQGLLLIPEGTTLRSFLASTLSCDAMRISKKFAGDDAYGKVAYTHKAAFSYPPPGEAPVDAVLVAASRARSRLRASFLAALERKAAARERRRAYEHKDSADGSFAEEGDTSSSVSVSENFAPSSSSRTLTPSTPSTTTATTSPMSRSSSLSCLTTSLLTDPTTAISASAACWQSITEDALSISDENSVASSSPSCCSSASSSSSLAASSSSSAPCSPSKAGRDENEGREGEGEELLSLPFSPKMYLRRGAAARQKLQDELNAVGASTQFTTTTTTATTTTSSTAKPRPAAVWRLVTRTTSTRKASTTTTTISQVSLSKKRSRMPLDSSEQTKPHLLLLPHSPSSAVGADPLAACEVETRSISTADSCCCNDYDDDEAEDVGSDNSGASSWHSTRARSDSTHTVSGSGAEEEEEEEAAAAWDVGAAAQNKTRPDAKAAVLAATALRPHSGSASKKSSSSAAGGGWVGSEGRGRGRGREAEDRAAEAAAALLMLSCFQ